MEIITDLELINSIDNNMYSNIIELYGDASLKDIDRALQLKRKSEEGDKESITALVRFLDSIIRTLVESGDYLKQLESLEGTLGELTEGNDSAKGGWERVKSSLSELENFLVIKKKLKT